MFINDRFAWRSQVVASLNEIEEKPFQILDSHFYASIHVPVSHENFECMASVPKLDVHVQTKKLHTVICSAVFHQNQGATMQLYYES